MPTDNPPATPPEADVALPASAQELLDSASEVTGLIRLPPGIELSEENAQAMESERPTRLIVLAGAVDCGKTTLLTTLYQMFQEGPVKDRQFAGCVTFPAFEKKSHLGRIDSGNEEEDTIRNTYEGPHPEYVHLKMQNGSKALGHIDFIFTDVSGEMFEHARNSIDECKKLTFLRRACHILVFLDCEKLLHPKKRHNMLKDARTLIQSCLDSDMLEPDCYVTVVWAKYDFVEAAKGQEKKDALNLQKQTEEAFTAKFAPSIKNLKFHRAAVRPKQHPVFKPGHGVAELLEDWITKVPAGRKAEFDRLVTSVPKPEAAVKTIQPTAE